MRGLLNDKPAGVKLPTIKKMVAVVTTYYLVTSLAASIFGAIQPSTHIPDVIIQLNQFGPTVGVLAFWLFFRKRNDLLFSEHFRFTPTVIRRIVAAILLFVAIFVASVLVYKLIGQDAHYMHPGSLSKPFWIIVIAQFVGAAGEEFGWRSFLQPYLQTRLSVIMSSVIVGLLWGIWHIGIFSDGLPFAVSFIVSAVAISIILGELLRKTRGNNLYIATTFHALINLGLLLLFTEESGNVQSMVIVASACAVAAVATVVYNRLTLVSPATT